MFSVPINLRGSAHQLPLFLFPDADDLKYVLILKGTGSGGLYSESRVEEMQCNFGILKPGNFALVIQRGHCGVGTT